MSSDRWINVIGLFIGAAVLMVLEDFESGAVWFGLGFVAGGLWMLYMEVEDEPTPPPEA